jgi:pimeloyl-ACP methyl ester carboxylesterase
MPFATNDGVRIHYQVAGAGPALVLMHGIGTTERAWTDLGYVDRFAPHFTVVTIDGRGHGRSDRPRVASAYVRENRRDDTLAVMDALGIDQAHLMGYSLGARCAMYVATWHPERALSVVAAGANPYPSEVNMPLTRPLRRAMARSGSAPLALLARVKGRLFPDAQRIVGPLIEASDRGRHFDVELSVERMRMPVLVISGERDERFALEKTREWTSRLANARLEVVPDVGHGLFQTPGSLLPYAEPFLMELRAGVV